MSHTCFEFCPELFILLFLGAKHLYTSRSAILTPPTKLRTCLVIFKVMFFHTTQYRSVSTELLTLVVFNPLQPLQSAFTACLRSLYSSFIDHPIFTTKHFYPFTTFLPCILSQISMMSPFLKNVFISSPSYSHLKQKSHLSYDGFLKKCSQLEANMPLLEVIVYSPHMLFCHANLRDFLICVLFVICFCPLLFWTPFTFIIQTKTARKLL